MVPRGSSIASNCVVNEPGDDSGSGARSRARWGIALLRRLRFSFGGTRRLLFTLVLGCLSMAVTIWIVPGMSAGLAADVLLATVLLGILAALLRPLLTSFALLLGWAGVLLAGVVAQALLFYLALSLTPVYTSTGSGTRSGPPGSSRS